MVTLDEFFNTPSETPKLHPRLREWKNRLDAGATAALKITPQNPWGGPPYDEMRIHFDSKDEMCIHFDSKLGRRNSESLVWSDEINSGLIDLGVCAISVEQEAERFALGLRSALRRATFEFGDGYFNSVFVEWLRSGPFNSQSKIADVLQHIETVPPSKEADRQESYVTCRQLIEDAIRERAQELTQKLHYSQEEAKRILVSAIAIYLDRRFSVSNRRHRSGI
jgi:hypothetical protein